MSDNESKGAGSDPNPIPGRLAKPVQDHLGRELRAVYNQLADKPAYLGDPALPPELEHQLVRLDAVVEVHEMAVEAVKNALEEALEHEKAGEAVREPNGGFGSGRNNE